MTTKNKRKKKASEKTSLIQIYRIVIPEVDASGKEPGTLWWADVTKDGISKFEPVTNPVDYKMLDVGGGEELTVYTPMIYESVKFVSTLCKEIYPPHIRLLNPAAFSAPKGVDLTTMIGWLRLFQQPSVMLTANICTVLLERSELFTITERVTEYFNSLKQKKPQHTKQVCCGS